MRHATMPEVVVKLMERAPMTEKLTDEQLRERLGDRHSKMTRAMAAELLALRTERANPTQSDASLAKEALRLIRWMEQGAHNAFADRPILAAFASIRAELRKP